MKFYNAAQKQRAIKQVEVRGFSVENISADEDYYIVRVAKDGEFVGELTETEFIALWNRLTS